MKKIKKKKRNEISIAQNIYIGNEHAFAHQPESRSRASITCQIPCRNVIFRILCIALLYRYKSGRIPMSPVNKGGCATDELYLQIYALIGHRTLLVHTVN